MAGLIERCDCLGTLTIAGILLQCDAWCFPDLDQLLNDPDYLGDLRHIPGSNVNLSYGRDEGSLIASLEGKIVGDYDRFGNALAMSLTAGLLHNIDALKTITAAVTTDPGTRAAVLTRADGTVLTAAVLVGPLKWAMAGAPGIANATLRIEIPDGRFV